MKSLGTYHYGGSGGTKDPDFRRGKGKRSVRISLPKPR